MPKHKKPKTTNNTTIYTSSPTDSNKRKWKNKEKGKGKLKEKLPESSAQLVVCSSAVTLDSELAQYFANHSPDVRKQDELMEEGLKEDNDWVSLRSN